MDETPFPDNAADDTPEVMFFLFVRGHEPQSVEMEVRRALKNYTRKYYLAVFDVQRFPGIADTYQVLETPSLIMDDLVTGDRARCCGDLDAAKVSTFLKDGVKTER
jgi:hypothetical protein